jgi:hypothetical protein
MASPALAAPAEIAPEAEQGAATRLVIPWPEIVAAVAGLRLLLSLVGAGIPLLLPQPHQPGGLSGLLIEPWRQFDAQRFTEIAAHGYQSDSLNTAYLPLYPLLIRIASLITFGHMLTAALLVSNVACVIGVGLLWRWIAGLFGQRVAWRSVALLLLYPDAFYLLGGYSESLFLALSAGCLLALSRRAMTIAGLLAVLAVLTRLQGLVLLMPIALATWRGRHDPGVTWRGLAALLMPPAWLAVYQRVLMARLGGGDIVDTFQHRWHISLQAPWQTIWQYVSVIRSPRWHLIHSPDANYVMLWDLSIGLLVLAVLILSARRLGLDLTLFGLAAWCFAMSRWYSTGRYMLAVLPFFVALGLWAEGRRLRWVATCSLMLLVFFTSEFVQGSWVD